MLNVNKMWKSQFLQKIGFSAVPRRKIATNYPTSSRYLSNVLRLPSKVEPPMLAEWKSGSGSPKRASKLPKTGLWPAERSELGSKLNFSVIGMQNGFSPKMWALWVLWGPGSTRQLRLFGLLEPDFQSANVGGAAFEGSLKTFLRDMDGVGE